jgi:hypothetical protein
MPLESEKNRLRRPSGREGFKEVSLLSETLESCWPAEEFEERVALLASKKEGNESSEDRWAGLAGWAELAEFRSVYSHFPEASDLDEAMASLQADPDVFDLLLVFLLRVLRTARG